MISCDLQAVVASSDTSVLSFLPARLKTMGILPTPYGQAAEVIEAVRRQRVDAVFIDWDLDPEFSVLREIRGLPAGRRLIAMAVISRQAPIREAFRFADFVLEKPLLSDRVAQTLRAAHGMMVRERLQYTRIPLATEAMIFNCQARSCSGIATNVSQTGIALESEGQFVAGEIVQIHFRLPGLSEKLACRAKAIWTDSRTKTGFSFLEMKSGDRKELSSWIENQFIEGWQEKVPQVQAFARATLPVVGPQSRSA